MSEDHDSENSGAVDNGPIYPQSSTNQEAESIKLSHVDSKEDMFMDASDELNNDNKEAGAPTARQNDAFLEEKPNAVARQFDEMENGAYNNEDNDIDFVNEMERLRALLEQAVDEKEKLEVKYKEEMEVLAREIYMKDQEIEGLNAKVMSSVAEAGKEVYVEKNQQCEVAMKRILAALGSVVEQGDLLGDSGGEQIDLVEKSTLALIEKYNQFLFEVNQLRQCLTKAEYDFGVQEFGTLFVSARDELFELRRKEAELVEKIGLLEDGNRKLLEQVENEKATVEMLNSELGKTKTEVEQEKMKCANTKEKLSMAVTKGKALVQQRDALKQSLADKTSELDKCLFELREKSSALEAAELYKEELVKSENLVASLQESLSQKTLILETFEHILSHIDVPEELQSVDIVGRARWLSNERNELKGVSLDFYRLKDTICAIDLPENVSFSDLDSRLAWLKESFYHAKDEINMLQNEISRTKEAARDEIDHLSASLSSVQQEKDYIKEELDHLRSKYDEIVGKAHRISLDKDHLSASLAAELTEKDYIQKEMDDLTSKYEKVVEKVHQLSSEKDQMFRLLVEGSGIVVGDQEGIEETSSNLLMLIDRCLGKIKEQTSASLETPFVDAELFEKLQSLLYVRDLEFTLCEEILEEDMLVRSQLNDLSNQFRITSQELFALKEEKDVLQKDLERSEEKSGLLGEKLSVAVKKGKGLVQDRENLKVLLEEKKSEIEKLRLELQQEESTVAECRDRISTLSTDLERIPKLESDLATMKEERDELEKFLFESNSILHRVVESIDRIVIPVDLAFLEPIEKLNLLAGYIDDCQIAKTQTEQELREVKEEASNLAGKLAEAQATMKLLEDTLAVVKNDLSQLAEEKREMEFVKKNIEIELQKAIEEAHSQTNKFAETCEARKSLEEALSLAENKISLLISEKEEVQGSKAVSEMEVEKVREEVATQTSRFAEAYNTIKSLENALSQAEMTVASLTEQSNNAQVEITNLETELKKLKSETETQASQLTDAGTTIKSLEDALVKAENDFSALLGEKRTADQEVSTLNSKLNACMEELAGSSGSLASRSTELIGHLNDLQMLAQDQSLLSTMKQCFDRNLERLKDGDLAIKNTREHLFDKDLELLQGFPLMEDTANLPRRFTDDTDNTVNIEMENDEANAINADDVSSCFRRVAEGFQLRNKILADRFEGFSNFLDESIAALLKKLQATEDEVKSIVKNMESLKRNVKNLEVSEQEKEKAIDHLRSKYEEIVGKAHQISLDKDHLSASLAAELTEKDYIQKEMDDLTSKYEKVVEKVHQLSSEKDQMFRLLVERSGIVVGDKEGIEEISSNLPMLIDRCLGKKKEQTSASLETPFVDAELFEKLQSLLYVRDLEFTLCEEILEEDMLLRSQLNDLSNQFRVTSQELFALKEEKDVLQKDLERSEEKSGLLREKLSMAVKKGKGLVQDRENLKVLLGEKKSEIEKLRLEFQLEESTVAECRDRISTLSTDLELIPNLESDLAAMKEERDQLEKFLSERNSILHRVVESIDRIVIPVDSAFLEPVEKLNLLAGYIDDCQTAKTKTEQEFREVNEEASNLAGKLAEAQATMKLLEDALAVVKNDLSQLAEEKREMEFFKNNIEIELQKAIEEAHSQTNKCAETCEARKSLEEALSLAENKISLLISEKEEVQVSKAASEMEVEKVREEVAIQTSRLTEAYNTIKSLENALSQAEMTVASLTEQSNNAQVEITNFENELKKLKNETETQASQLTDAGTTIKSLEDALVKAENDFSALLGEKRTADQEVSTLNSKLNACMEELAGSSGSLASRSIELIGHLNNLQMLAKDQSLLSTMKQCFERNLERLNDVDLAIKNTREHLFDKDLELLQGYPLMEDIANLPRRFSDDTDNTVNIEMENDEANAINAVDVSSCFRRVAEGFQLRNKILADRFEGFSNFLDESIAALLKKLQATKDEVKSMVKNMESLKRNVKNLEMSEQEKEKAIAMLQNDVAILRSACIDATGNLQFEVNNLIELSSIPGLEKLNHGLHPKAGEFVGDDMAQQEFGSNLYAQIAEKLLTATRKVQSLVKFFKTSSKAVATVIHDLQKELEDTRKASEKAIEERDVYQSRVFTLESDVEALEDSCREVRLKVEDYQAKEDRWKEKEAELLSLYNSLLMKEKEAEEPLLSASQSRTLLEKLSGIEIPLVETEDPEPHSSADVKKLFSVIGSFTDLQNQINLLSYEKEELQPTLARHIFEIEHLKEEIGTHVRNKPDLEEMKTELSEVTFGLEKIIVLLGGKEFIGGQNSVGMKTLLPILEKQVNALLLEAENSKSKAQELGTKLVGSQKVVNELSTKVKLLEDSIQGRTVLPEIVQERSILETPSAPTGSEISEIEDAGSFGKNTISPVPLAAHVRTMRKGSPDHLALNIDSESVRLINSEETDEEKGHLFKSLNTSGIIPKQGKLIADRVDGIWVSGGRVLSSRPRARLGLITYCLLLHIWLLGTIL